VQRRCLVFGFLGSFKGAIAVPRGSGRIASYRRVARGPGAHPPGVPSALIQEVAPKFGPSIGASRSRPAAEDCPIGALGGIFGRFDSSGPGAPFWCGGLWRARDRGPRSIRRLQRCKEGFWRADDAGGRVRREWAQESWRSEVGAGDLKRGAFSSGRRCGRWDQGQA